LKVLKLSGINVQRFRHVEHVDGEPTGDGSVVVYYGKRGKVVAVEITNITTL
jgi:uncharacterized protein YuzE